MLRAGSASWSGLVEQTRATNPRTGGQRHKDRRPPLLFYLDINGEVTCPSYVDAAVANMVSEPFGVYVHTCVWLFGCNLLPCDVLLFASISPSMFSLLLLHSVRPAKLHSRRRSLPRQSVDEPLYRGLITRVDIIIATG